MVGTSGSPRIRFLPATANARSFAFHYLWYDCRWRAESKLGVAADRRTDSRASAIVRYMHNVEAERPAKQFTCKVLPPFRPPPTHNCICPNWL